MCIFCDCSAGYVTTIFLSRQGRLQALKDYYHYLRNILASSDRRSGSFYRI